MSGVDVRDIKISALNIILVVEFNFTTQSLWTEKKLKRKYSENKIYSIENHWGNNIIVISLNEIKHIHINLLRKIYNIFK